MSDFVFFLGNKKGASYVSFKVTPRRALKKAQGKRQNRSFMHAQLHMSAISRKGGRSAVAASAYRSGQSVVACAAYRAGDKLHDERYTKTHDYSKKHHVVHAAIVAPEQSAEWMKERETLWNGVEAFEKRKDAQLAKEALLILPRNLSHEQQQEVVEGFIQDSLTSRGLIADYAIHEPDASDGGKNPHAHVLFTLRPVEGDSFGKKLTGYKDGGLDGKEFLQELKFCYTEHLNRVSSANDNNAPVFDLRSNKERGIDRLPQPKIGPKAKALESQGYRTERVRKVQKVQQINKAKVAQRRHIRSYQLIGGGSQQPAFVAESIRADLARKYYDVMYGRDGSHDDYSPHQSHEHER